MQRRSAPVCISDRGRDHGGRTLVHPAVLRGGGADHPPGRATAGRRRRRSAVAILLLIIVVLVLLAVWHAVGTQPVRHPHRDGGPGVRDGVGARHLSDQRRGGEPPQMRWAPIASLVSAAALALFVVVRPAVGTDTWWSVTAAVALVALANLPTHRSLASLNEEPEWLAAGVDLMSARRARGPGTVLYDHGFALRQAEPVEVMTFAELQDRGIPFVFTDEVWIRHLGEGRRDDGTATLRIWYPGARSSKGPKGLSASPRSSRPPTDRDPGRAHRGPLSVIAVAPADRRAARMRTRSAAAARPTASSSSHRACYTRSGSLDGAGLVPGRSQQPPEA